MPEEKSAFSFEVLDLRTQLMFNDPSGHACNGAMPDLSDLSWVQFFASRHIETR